MLVRRSLFTELPLPPLLNTMASVVTTRKLKRQASSDNEEGPTKQARTSVQNAHACRYPSLRRSDSQVLDINATSAVVEHLSHTCEPVSVPSELQHRSKVDEDEAGSTDEESQDEATAWDRRANAHRHNMLFKRPREPAPKVTRTRATILIRTASEIALNESDSEDEQPLKLVNFHSTGEIATRKVQRLMTLRAARATAAKQPGVSTAPPPPPAAVGAPAHPVTIPRRVTRAASKATLTAPALTLASLQTMQPVISLEQPRLKSDRVRRSAIDAIAGHRSTTAPYSLVASTSSMSTDSSPSSMPSQILRRSRRVATRQQSQLNI
ncbi:hypothetical protein RSOL_321670 [Rhizoctonia solani AG-3 Rhs1AP]|uniref:Uncharacterized protein n=2 Tax=Rhizoctonia solani AG-3 TaxID=1086053 RepID=A0A074S1A7_9AGAM|nr:hypothetical protein RSOL_321670 [Rhizoctonia solani AG-3 Rhs1AP]KEP51315.1 hypothetical protein V565_063950 [Rhizoctonia solani 123E]